MVWEQTKSPDTAPCQMSHQGMANCQVQGVEWGDGGTRVLPKELGKSRVSIALPRAASSNVIQHQPSPEGHRGTERGRSPEAAAPGPPGCRDQPGPGGGDARARAGWTLSPHCASRGPGPSDTAPPQTPGHQRPSSPRPPPHPHLLSPPPPRPRRPGPRPGHTHRLLHGGRHLGLDHGAQGKTSRARATPARSLSGADEPSPPKTQPCLHTASNEVSDGEFQGQGLREEL